MADISKCNGHNCPIKDACYRYTAPANKRWQAYGSFSYDKKNQTCESFWGDPEILKDLPSGIIID